MQPNRNLQSPTVKRFRGINMFSSYGTTQHDEAIDLQNVTCCLSGQLEKLRVPADITDATNVGGGTCNGFWDFQQADGTRQVVAVWGTQIWVYSRIAGAYKPKLIDDNVQNDARWSAVLSNNILYMANGRRMLQWTGDNLWKWGIISPSVKCQRVGTIAILKFARTAGVATYTINSGALTYVNTGDAFVILGIQDATFNIPAGEAITLVDDTHFTALNAGPDVPETAVAPGPATAQLLGGLTFTLGGRMHVMTFGNSVIGHESSCTPTTTISGNITTGLVRVVQNNLAFIAQLNADPQIDTVNLYSTQDGGGVWMFNQTRALDRSRPITQADLTFDDNKADNLLDGSRTAPFYNDPPPVGKYVKEWGGRIYIGNLVGAKSDMVYSGYEVILQGRPEQSFPQYNRITLGIGADELRGFGVLQSGLVAMSKSNEMFALNGIVEDVVIGTPVAYSETLTKLPWNTGAASHDSITHTPFGIHWLSAQKMVEMYMGWGQTASVAMNLIRALRNVPTSKMQLSVGAYFNYLDRDWYVCAVPQAGGAGPLDKLLVIDISDTNIVMGYTGKGQQGGSIGAWIYDIGSFDYLNIVESPDGTPMLVVAQGGLLKQINCVSDADNGVILVATPATDEDLDAWWESGYFGNESAQMYKEFRYANVICDDPSKVTLDVKLVDDRTRTVANPEIKSYKPTDNSFGRVGINRKARRATVKITFPVADQDFAVQELWLGYIPTSER